MKQLLLQIKNCKECQEQLEFGCNPVVSVSQNSKILIIGQAPGRIVHQTGIPWNDKSGDNLRQWLGVDKPLFYNQNIFALMPMGFCYPGTGKSGDLAPRPECAPLWHHQLLAQMPHVQLTLLIGQYAQNYYLKEKAKSNLTETVRNYQYYLPQYLVLPHPSPRNNIWLAKNEWFAKNVLPLIKNQVQKIIG